MVIAYDGTDYRGFWPNPDVATVGGELLDAIQLLLQREISLNCAGRTDAGVHARVQVLSFDMADDIDLGWFRHRLNRVLSDSIRVREVVEAAPDFHARFDATSRTYRYHILRAPVADPLRSRTTWHVREPLQLSSMRLGADAFIGSHNFASFCREPDPGPDGRPKTLHRRIFSTAWVEVDEELLYFEVSARAFCQQMVRSIVGTLVDVGHGRLRAGEIRSILAARDRSIAGDVAPPHGLTLWDVGYD